MKTEVTDAAFPPVGQLGAFLHPLFVLLFLIYYYPAYHQLTFKPLVFIVTGILILSVDRMHTKSFSEHINNSFPLII